jgi:predicted nucleotidyltransferase
VSGLSPAPPFDLDLPYEAIAAFCRRWRITELALFGSVLRDDFGPDSDIDVLVTFDPDARLSLFDLVGAQQELSDLLGREVDLVSKRGVEQSPNWIRRRAILASARPYYVER